MGIEASLNRRRPSSAGRWRRRTPNLLCAVLLAGAGTGTSAAAFAAADAPMSASSSDANRQDTGSQATGAIATPTPTAAPVSSPLLSYAAIAAQHGIYFRSYVDEEIAANPVGGIRHGITASQYATLGTDVDLQKLIGWKGAIFHASIIAEASTGLSAKYIGGGIDAQENYAPFNLVRFLNLTLEQNFSLFHKNDLNLVAGRMGAFPAFAKSD